MMLIILLVFLSTQKGELDNLINAANKWKKGGSYFPPDNGPRLHTFPFKVENNKTGYSNK